MRKVFLILLVTAVLFSTIGVGLSLAPYVAVRLGYAPFKSITIEDDSVTDALLQLIQSSRTEVLLATGYIDNLIILEALAQKTKEGVQIGVVLPEENGNKIALRWLKQNGIPTRSPKTPFRGTTIIVDRKTVAISTSPLAAKAVLSREQLTLMVFEHVPTAERYLELVKRQGGR